MTYTKEQLREAFKKLPEAVKNAIISIETTQIVEEIGKSYDLHLDQEGLLADEIGLTMVGLTNTSQFSENIQNRLQITREKSEKITTDLNQKIFLRIREAVQEASNSPEESSEPITSPAKTNSTPNVFEQKIGKIFSMPKEGDGGAAPKPWEQDPYLERP